MLCSMLVMHSTVVDDDDLAEDFVDCLLLLLL